MPLPPTPDAPPPPAPPSWRRRLLLVAVLLGLAAALACAGRTTVGRLFPLHHTGVVRRIGVVQGLGRPGPAAPARTFAILFDDGFVCESTTPAFAAVREGDPIHLRGYRDVSGWPLLDPGFGRCVDGQLVSVEVR